MNKTIRNLFQDDYFVKWVISPDHKSNEFWEAWIKNNPDIKNDIEKARNLIRSIEFTDYPIRENMKTDLWQKVEDHIRSSPEHSTQGYWNSYRVASVIALLVTFTTILFIGYNAIIDAKDIESKSIDMVHKKIPHGQKLTTYLPDATSVKLNSGSQLIYSSEFNNSTRREVELIGEAFFEVTKDVNKPFIITSGNIKTQVIGTSFNIKAYPQDHKIEVSVVTGKVVVNHLKGISNEELQLEKNDFAIYNRVQQKFELISFESDDHLAWKDGIIVFKNANFKEVVEQLIRWYGVEFKIEKNIDMEKDFSGRFDNQSLITVLQGISFAFGFDFEILNEYVVIR